MLFGKRLGLALGKWRVCWWFLLARWSRDSRHTLTHQNEENNKKYVCNDVEWRSFSTYVQDSMVLTPTYELVKYYSKVRYSYVHTTPQVEKMRYYTMFHDCWNLRGRFAFQKTPGYCILLRTPYYFYLLYCTFSTHRTHRTSTLKHFPKTRLSSSIAIRSIHHHTHIKWISAGRWWSWTKPQQIYINNIEHIYCLGILRRFDLLC